MESLSWTPILGTVTYCSPACGHGCTRQEHEAAQERGEMLAAILGEKWTFKVWENLGWHYKAVSCCGRVHVHPNGQGYTAFLGLTTSGHRNWCEHGATPAKAVAVVVKVVRQELRELQSLVEGL